MLDKILTEYNQHLDDPVWLSKTCVDLAALLFYHNTKMAVNEKIEKQAYLDSRGLDATGKVLPVEDRKAKAVVITNNDYGVYKAQNEAIIELINAMKSRIKVLTWEKNESANQ